MTQPPPAFTLIIPCHNSPAQDRRAMMQALEATIPDRPDLEVIWVDDHSTLPWQPRRAHAQTAHRLLSVPEGQRHAGAARNLGLDHAAGDWVLFADSDDLLVPDVIAQVFETAQTARDEVELILFRVGAFREDGRPATRHRYLDAIHTELQRTGNTDLLVDYHSCFGKLVRRRVIAAHDLRFEPVRFGNDVLFSVRLALTGPRWVRVDRVGYHLREGHASLTHAASREAVIARFERARQIHDLLRAAGRPDLMTPQRYLIRQYGFRAPLTVCAQTVISWWRGSPVFRARPRAGKTR